MFVADLTIVFVVVVFTALVIFSIRQNRETGEGENEKTENDVL